MSMHDELKSVKLNSVQQRPSAKNSIKVQHVSNNTLMETALKFKNEQILEGDEEDD